MDLTRASRPLRSQSFYSYRNEMYCGLNDCIVDLIYPGRRVRGHWTVLHIITETLPLALESGYIWVWRGFAPSSSRSRFF